ncbi:hypothetical protein, partial [Staphylococcus pseudintermedius]|uniref:hypothetical protein n=1 Tax=Staphylococcus pseudintermedius TaxID=283734 RepID=UPI000E38ABF7
KEERWIVPQMQRDGGSRVNQQEALERKRWRQASELQQARRNDTEGLRAQLKGEQRGQRNRRH